MTSCLRTLRHVAAGIGVLGILSLVVGCTAGTEEAPVGTTPLAGTLNGQSFVPTSALARTNSEGTTEIYLFPTATTCDAIDSAQEAHERWVHVITPGPLVVGEVWNVDMEHQKDGVRFAGRVNRARGSAGRGRLEVVRFEGEDAIVRMRATWKSAWTTAPTEDLMEGEILVRSCK